MARATFAEAANRGEPVGVPTISLVEIVYLTEKGRIPEAALETLERELKVPGSVLATVPLDQNVALSIRKIDRATVPDLPDRIIAATALHLGVPLISRDRKIQVSGVKTIW